MSFCGQLWQVLSAGRSVLVQLILVQVNLVNWFSAPTVVLSLSQWGMARFSWMKRLIPMGIALGWTSCLHKCSESRCIRSQFPRWGILLNFRFCEVIFAMKFSDNFQNIVKMLHNCRFRKWKLLWIFQIYEERKCWVITVEISRHLGTTTLLGRSASFACWEIWDKPCMSSCESFSSTITR